MSDTAKPTSTSGTATSTAISGGATATSTATSEEATTGATETEADSPPPAKKSRWTAGAVIGVVVGIATAVYVANRPTPQKTEPLVDLFQHVETQGYVANRSLAGRFAPGDVLQLREADVATPEGPGRELQAPILALRGETCFPDLEAVSSPFPLPERVETSQASLGLEGVQVTRTFPGLAVADSAASSWRLVFDRPSVVAIPKLEMSGNFAPVCVEKLEAARQAGDRLEWFATVHEAVVAEGFLFEVEWKSDTSADVAASLRQKTEKALERPSKAAGEPLVTAIQVDADRSSERKTVWKVEARVVLGYRTRPMEPLFPVASPVSSEGLPSPALPLAAALFAAPGDAASLEGVRRDFEDPEGSFLGRLGLEVLDADGRWRRVGPDHEFRTGDQFRFVVESSQPARLFVFHQAPGGEKTELWPASRPDPNRLTRDQSLLVPAKGATFQMQDEVGEETFYVTLAADAGAPADKKKAINYVLRGLDQAETRGVGIVDSWLYFEPSKSAGALAAVAFQLRHGPGAAE